MLCVPLQSPTAGLVGVLCMQRLAPVAPTSSVPAVPSIEGGGRFTDDHASALFSLGEFVASALRNAALLEQTSSEARCGCQHDLATQS